MVRLLFTVFSQQCKPVIIHSVFTAMQTCYYSPCFHSNANLLLFTVISQLSGNLLLGHEGPRWLLQPPLCFTVGSLAYCKPAWVIHSVFTADTGSWSIQEMCCKQCKPGYVFTVFWQQWWICLLFSDCFYSNANLFPSPFSQPCSSSQHMLKPINYTHT